MYILASDFSKKEINTYLKLEIRDVCREFLAFNDVPIYRFFETKQMIIYIFTSEILKLAFKIGFSVHKFICICVGR